MNTTCFLPLFLLLLPCAVFADEPAACVHVQPEIIGIERGALQNAGCGAEIWHSGPDNGEERLIQTAVRVSKYAVNSMIRVNWLDGIRPAVFVDTHYFNRRPETLLEYRERLGQFIETAGME